MAGIRKFVGVVQALLSETGLAQVLAKASLTDAQARATLANASSLAAGLRAIGITVAAAASSATAAPTPSPTPSQTPTPAQPNNPALFGPLGFNVGSSQLDFYGAGFPFIDRGKTSSKWVGGDNSTTAIPYNANGHPTAIPSGVSRLEKYVNVEGSNGPAGVAQHYTIRTTRTDATFTIAYASVISDVTTGGVRKIVVDASNPNDFINGGKGFGIIVAITALPTPFALSDTFNVYRSDEEAKFDAGQIFTDQFIARFALVDVIRMMDWLPANRTNVTSWSQRPQVAWDQWSEGLGVPLEIQIALCNATNKHGWFHIPVSCDDDYAVKAATMIHDNLKSSLLAGCEFGNENWNYGFGQYGYLYNLTPAVPGAHGDPASRQSGYLGTRKLGLMAKVFGFSTRFRPIWGIQCGSTEDMAGNQIGIAQAMSEWADPTNANHDADLAAHYQEAGQFYLGGLMQTSYINGGISWGGVNDADKATIESWQAADVNGDDANGLAKLFRQMEFGDVLATPGGVSFTMAGYANLTAGVMAQADQLGLVTGCYEGNVELQIPASRWDGQSNRPQMQAFFTKAINDPRMRGFFTRKLKMTRALGMTIDDTLAELGGVGDTYATLTDPYATAAGNLSQRGFGMQDFQANPGPYKALAIASIVQSGYPQVGMAQRARVNTTGGLGIVTIKSVTGLVEGRSHDGFRNIIGTFTTEHDTAVVASVTVQDQAGNTATATFNQLVGPALPDQTGGHRYFRLQVNALQDGVSPPDDNPILAKIILLASNGAHYDMGKATLTVDDGSVHNDLIDQNGDTLVGLPKNAVGNFYIDMGPGNIAIPGSVVLHQSVYTGNSPGKFTFAYSDDKTTWTNLYQNTTGTGGYPSAGYSFNLTYPGGGSSSTGTPASGGGPTTGGTGNTGSTGSTSTTSSFPMEQYFRLEVYGLQNPGNSTLQVVDLFLEDENSSDDAGATDDATWYLADGSTADQLNDRPRNSDWVTIGGVDPSTPVVLHCTRTAAHKISAFGIYPLYANSAPVKFKLYGSTSPIPTTGGTLLLAVDETSQTNWADTTRRNFLLS